MNQPTKSLSLTALAALIALGNCAYAEKSPIEKPPAVQTGSEPAEAEGPVADIQMYVGESRDFAASGVVRVDVGSGKVLRADQLDGKRLLVYALEAGESSLLLWKSDRSVQRAKVTVSGPNPTQQQLKSICAYLGTKPGVSCESVGGMAVVKGSELPDGLIEEIDAMSKRVPGLVNRTNRVGHGQMVCMEVKVVEFPINALRELGIKWSPTGGAAVGAIWSPVQRGSAPGYSIAPPTGAPITAVAGALMQPPSALIAKSLVDLGLAGTLSMLQQDGTATVLAQPRLCTLSTSKASFLAGGEVPYVTQSQQGPGVVFKTYGVKLDISPQLEAEGGIRANVAAEVSSIDTSVPSSAGPALSTRRVEDVFKMQAGETLVLSGLLQRVTSTDIDKVPLLGDLPLLGALFRSKRYQNKETELVVFVTPTLASASSPDNLSRIERAKERELQSSGVVPSTSTVPSTSAPDSVSRIERPLESPPQSQGEVSSTSAQVSKFTVVANDAVLRGAPNANAPALVKVHAGAVVTDASRASADTPPADWRLVRSGSTVGWIPVASVRAAQS